MGSVNVWPTWRSALAAAVVVVVLTVPMSMPVPVPVPVSTPTARGGLLAAVPGCTAAPGQATGPSGIARVVGPPRDRVAALPGVLFARYSNRDHGDGCKPASPCVGLSFSGGGSPTQCNRVEAEAVGRHARRVRLRVVVQETGAVLGQGWGRVQADACLPVQYRFRVVALRLPGAGGAGDAARVHVWLNGVDLGVRDWSAATIPNQLVWRFRHVLPGQEQMAASGFLAQTALANVTVQVVPCP
jgi:hypothetical protein